MLRGFAIYREELSIVELDRRRYYIADAVKWLLKRNLQAKQLSSSEHSLYLDSIASSSSHIRLS